MSDTPRCDAKVIPGEHDDLGLIECIPIELGRELERENAALREAARAVILGWADNMTVIEEFTPLINALREVTGEGHSAWTPCAACRDHDYCRSLGCTQGKQDVHRACTSEDAK